MAEATEPNGDFKTFLKWEGATRDTIDFKVAYVDMAGDVMAGLLLSQIVYWYLPNKQGKSKLRVQKNGYFWIVKARDAWWDEIRLTARQVDRALQLLKDKGLIETACHRFAGAPTTHIRICKDAFLKAWRSILEESPISPNGEITNPLNQDGGNSPNGEMDIDEMLKSLTETTPEITLSETTILPPSAESSSESDLLPPTENPDSITNRPADSDEECQGNSGSTGDYGGDLLRQAGTKPSFTVPPEAGGADAFADGPLEAFCQLVKTRSDLLSEKKRRQWAKKLREIAGEHGIDAAEMTTCIGLLPKSDWAWRVKGLTKPYEGGFDGVIGALILRRLSGEPILTDDGKGSSSGPRHHRKRGAMRGSTWTEQELWEAARESLATCPAHILLGCDTEAEFFALTPDEFEERLQGAHGRAEAWQAAATGDVAQAIAEMGGIEVDIDWVRLRWEMRGS